MKKIILSIALIISTVGLAQNLEIIQKTDSIPNVKYKGLTYINSNTNLENYYHLCKIKIESNDFNEILQILQKTALNFNANAFKLLESEKEGDKTTVFLNLFSAKYEFINRNNQLNELNTIYFFGNDTKKQKFKIDSKRIILKPEEILKYKVPKDSEIKINKGGITGESRYHKWNKNQFAIYYIFGKGNFSGSSNSGYSNLLFTINTGRIYEMDSNFAKLFLDLKK